MRLTNALVLLLATTAAVVGFRAGPASSNAQAEHAELAEDKDWQAYVGDADTTLDMNKRCSEAIAALEQRVQALLDSLYADMDDQADALLKQNQAEWQRYAQSKRALDADTFRGGSFAGVNAGLGYVATCKDRIEELKSLTEARKPK